VTFVTIFATANSAPNQIVNGGYTNLTLG